MDYENRVRSQERRWLSLDWKEMHCMLLREYNEYSMMENGVITTVNRLETSNTRFHRYFLPSSLSKNEPDTRHRHVSVEGRIVYDYRFLDDKCRAVLLEGPSLS